MNRPALAVMLYERHVANLLDAGFGQTAVQYTPTALADPIGSRLSLSMPVRPELYPGGNIGTRWTRSLLPEGRALDWAVEQFHISPDDSYGLIAALGADVAGAVRVLRDPITVAETGTYELLDAEHLAELVVRAHAHGLGLDRDRGVRLSLAGQQDKLLLHRDRRGYLLPINGAPSSLIVKPEPQESKTPLPGLASNELLCLTLAARTGLDVARASIERFGTVPSLVVQRFDRKRVKGGELERIHQEDLLGALGIDPLIKYERPQAMRRAPGGGFADMGGAVVALPGPSLAQLAAVLRQHLGAARLVTFLQAVTFNVVIGNADAHARNYSVLLERNGDVSFAPLYDLISTRYYPTLDAEPAQLISGVDDIDDVRIEDLVAEAAAWGLPESLALSRLTATVRRALNALQTAVEAAISKGADREATEAVATLIEKRAKVLLEN